MIDVGILGGASSQAGELIRILINHPDVIIRQVYASELANSDVKAVHHGLIGECNLKFTNTLEVDKLDVLFITSEENMPSELVPSVETAPELCVIDMVSDFGEARREDAFVVYGVPEVNRKALVRGAKRAVIPSAVESLVCIALLPLAMRSMLPDDIAVDVTANPELYKYRRFNMKHVADVFHINGNMNNPAISFKFHDSDSRRVMRLKTEINLPLPLDNIIGLYEEVYDDHNLTHVVSEPVEDKEVEGTDKCIISLDKTPEGILQIEIVADARMRGGAGDAVHVMNLLTGLYEKTGLALKASNY